MRLTLAGKLREPRWFRLLLNGRFVIRARYLVELWRIRRHVSILDP
jgi:hypothetical protein